MLYIFSDDIKEQVQEKLEDSIINDVPKEFQNTNQNKLTVALGSNLQQQVNSI